jgi:hypothetical protein
MLLAKIGQLTSYSIAYGKSAEELAERPTPRSCCTNYSTVDEIPMGEEVLVGTFFLNECLIIILFDSGASHDFMSSACVERAKLTLVTSRAQYVISTLRGRVDTDRIA